MPRTPRHTNRVTHSHSVTSSQPLPPSPPATNVDPAIIRQCEVDCLNDAYWGADPSSVAARAAIRNILAQYTMQHPLGRWTERQYQAVVRTVVNNDRYRPRMTPAAAPAETSQTELAELEEAATPLPEPETPLPTPLPGVFDPPLTAQQIALGWGLKGGTIVSRFAAQYPDFPASTTRGVFKEWYYSDIVTWTARHPEAIEKALRRSQGMPANPRETKAQLKARIAELEAQVRS